MQPAALLVPDLEAQPFAGPAPGVLKVPDLLPPVAVSNLFKDIKLSTLERVAKALESAWR